jgi:phosphoglycolate phosphatase-like HAD superfamily hydrolase
VSAVAIDFDAVLGDTRPLRMRWEANAARRFGGEDANWERLLERFAEEHAAAYLRRDGAANAALRRLDTAGVRIGAFTDSPEPLARVAAAQLGVERHLEVLECGPDALERLLERLGPVVYELRNLNESLQALAYAALGRQGPQVRRRRAS